MKKNNPTKSELEELWWYRLFKISSYLIIIIALFAPSILKAGVWYFDGVISALIWYVIIIVILTAIKYVIYGKSPRTEKFKKEKEKQYFEIFLIFLFVGMYLSMIWVNIISM